MGAIEDFNYLSSQIISLKVNTLFGMPSYILQYLEDQQEELKHYGGIEKIFYGGEHFSKGQRQWITDTFNISFIKSASYGSVDAGPIGHQSVNSENGVHHLNDQLQSLKIVKLDSLEPVVGDEVGRLIVSTPSREAMKVLNYDIGDLGRWVKGKCPCGSESPRFELLGRTGDIFRAAGNFLNYKKFESLLEEAGFQGEFQLIMSNSGSKDNLEMRYVAPEPFAHLDSMYFVNEIKELREAVLDEGVLGFKISKCQSSDLIRVKSSGKLRRVIDQREYE